MLTAAWLLLTLAGCMFSSLERGLARPGRMGLQAWTHGVACLDAWGCRPGRMGLQAWTHRVAGLRVAFLLAPSYWLLPTSCFLRPTFYLLLTACGGGYGGRALVRPLVDGQRAAHVLEQVLG